MTHKRPTAEAMSREGKGTAAAGEAGNSRPIRWEDAQQRLTKGGWFWLATVRPDGAPHAMPVFAVWSESVLFVSSKETARKSRNLAADGRPRANGRVKLERKGDPRGVLPMQG